MSRVGVLIIVNVVIGWVEVTKPCTFGKLVLHLEAPLYCSAYKHLHSTVAQEFEAMDSCMPGLLLEQLLVNMIASEYGCHVQCAIGF